MIQRSNPGHSVVGLTVGMTAWLPPQQQDNVNGEQQHLAGPPPFSQHHWSPGQVPPGLILSTCTGFHSPLVSFPSSEGCNSVSASFWFQEAVSNRWGQTGGGSWKSLVIARQSLVTNLGVGGWNSPRWSKYDFITFSKSRLFSGYLFVWFVCFFK